MKPKMDTAQKIKMLEEVEAELESGEADEFQSGNLPQDTKQLEVACDETDSGAMAEGASPLESGDGSDPEDDEELLAHYSKMKG